MIEASCHCGGVHLEIETAPETVTDCNCSICRRYGVLWAYYSPTKVHIRQAEGATDVYIRSTRVNAFHRCANCGCVVYWKKLDTSIDRMGVNARLMDPAVLAAARVRYLDGADTWTYRDE